MSNEKKIIILLAVFLVTGVSFLFYSENKQLNSTDGGWALYFENPKSTDLTFVIENRGKTKKIHWKELSGNPANTLREGDVVVSSEQKSIIPLSGADISKGEKITIEASDQSDGKKEIHKLLY
jgi:hypothetical protein